MRGPARAITRIAAVAAGTLMLLVTPAVLGGVLADDGGGTVSAGAPVARNPTPARPAPAPATGSSGSPGRTRIPAVPAAPRPVPLGVAAGGLAPSPPVTLSIPALGVSSALERLGVREDGTLAPPADYGQAGWFAGGVEPGQPGPAVIAGHVDSRTGPAVFYRLGELTAGDVVEVERADGSTVTFRVTDVAEHPKDAFPTEAVYGPVPGSELRLVTCTGVFDDDTGHYVSNLVVFATLT
jgi:Sortase domain